MAQESANRVQYGARTEQVYFTVCIGVCTGLADTLHRYQFARKLGLSLGYTYCHTRLTFVRHLLPPNLLPVWARGYGLGKTWRQLAKKLKWVASRATSQNVYDFLGLNQCFPGKNRFPKKSRCHISLSDNFLQENNISSYEELTRYMQTFVAQRKKAGFPLLLVLEIYHPLYQSEKILCVIPDSIDPLDFRTVYFQRQKKRPRKSGFARGRLKILAHLRLGDRAAAQTPWGTWIHRMQAGEQRPWEQSRSEQDFLQLTTTDFYQFMRNLLGHLPPDVAHTQIFSDGFERTIRYVCKPKWIYPAIALAELRLLGKGLKYQQRLLVPLFQSLPNSTCFIGEKQSQLFRLIHVVIEADLIITAFPIQHNLLTFLARFYRKRETLPVILLLQKPDATPADSEFAKSQSITLDWLWEGISDKINFVDISAPSFPGLARQIMHQWKRTATDRG